MGGPPSRGLEQPSQGPGPGVPQTGAGETGLQCATQPGSYLEGHGAVVWVAWRGLLLKAEKPGTSDYITGNYSYLSHCQKKSMPICDYITLFRALGQGLNKQRLISNVLRGYRQAVTYTRSGCFRSKGRWER